MRARSPFAEFRLHAAGRRRAGRALVQPEFERARELIAEVHAHEGFDLAPLLAELEPHYGEGPSVEELHDHLARLLTRGLLDVERVPLDPQCSELPELLEVVLEHAPVENEIDDGVSVLADAKPEPALTLEVMFELEPAPRLEHANVIEPAPVLEYDNNVEPPEQTPPT